jgi:hypothetical protein
MDIVKYKDDVWAFKNFITDEECDGVIKMFNQLEASGDFVWNPISFYESYAYNMPHQLFPDEKVMAQKYADAGLPDKFFDDLEDKFKKAAEMMIGGPAFKISFHSQKWIPGAYARFHSDNSYDGKASAFERSRYAGFLYLNDEFEGGLLNFENHPITIKPEKGMFAFFDGGHSNTHEVTPIFKADRYTVGSFWDDRDESDYPQDKLDAWAEEIKETREKQKIEQDEWEKIREDGLRLTQDGQVYPAEKAKEGTV